MIWASKGTIMSFIYEDDNLIMDLLKLAQTAKPVAPAPAAPKTPAAEADLLPPDQQKIQLEKAKQLVKNLQTQLDGGAVFTAERDDADVHAKNLVNLESLLYFLQYNGIKYNGLDIVIKADIATLGGIKSPEHVKQPGYFDFPAPPAKPVYYVLKEGLEKYLRDLQAKNNPVLNAYISRLIDEVNNVFKFGLSKDPAAPKPTELKDNEGHNWKGVLTMHPAKDPKEQPAAQKNLQQSLAELVENLPLSRDDINFERMNTFFDLYAKLIATNPDKAATAMDDIARARAAIAQVQSLTNDKIFRPIGTLNSDDVMNWLKPGTPATAYATLLNGLRQSVTNAVKVVSDFYYAFGRGLNSQQQNLVGQQMVGGTSYYRTNVDVLDKLKNETPRVLSTGPRR